MPAPLKFFFPLTSMINIGGWLRDRQVLKSKYRNKQSCMVDWLGFWRQGLRQIQIREKQSRRWWTGALIGRQGMRLTQKQNKVGGGGLFERQTQIQTQEKQSWRWWIDWETNTNTNTRKTKLEVVDWLRDKHKYKYEKNKARGGGLIERQGMRPNLSRGSHMSLSHNALDASSSKYQKTTKSWIQKRNYHSSIQDWYI